MAYTTTSNIQRRLATHHREMREVTSWTVPMLGVQGRPETELRSTLSGRPTWWTRGHERSKGLHAVFRCQSTRMRGVCSRFAFVACIELQSANGSGGSWAGKPAKTCFGARLFYHNFQLPTPYVIRESNGKDEAHRLGQHPPATLHTGGAVVDSCNSWV